MREAAPTTVLGRFDSTAFADGGVTSTFLRRGNRLVVNTQGADARCRSPVGSEPPFAQAAPASRAHCIRRPVHVISAPEWLQDDEFSDAPVFEGQLKPAAASLVPTASWMSFSAQSERRRSRRIRRSRTNAATSAAHPSGSTDVTPSRNLQLTSAHPNQAREARHPVWRPCTSHSRTRRRR
jgi:hypothetical protein